MSTSIIQRETPRLPGLEPETMDILEAKNSTAGVFTAEKLYAGQPRLYRAAVNLLARGASQAEVAKILEMSPNTVLAISRREAPQIEVLKQSLGRDFVEVAQLAAQTARDRLSDPEDAKKIGFKDLMIGAAVATDKAMLLAGEPTSITEQRRADPDDFERLLKEARSKGKVIDVVPEDTGIGSGRAGENAGPAVAPAALGPEVEPGARSGHDDPRAEGAQEVACTDIESVGGTTNRHIMTPKPHIDMFPDVDAGGCRGHRAGPDGGACVADVSETSEVPGGEGVGPAAG